MDAKIPPPPANPRGASPVDPLPPAGSITSIADSLDHNASATTGIDFDKFPAGKRARVKREAARFQVGRRFRNAYHAVRARSTARMFLEPPDVESVGDDNLVRSMYYHEQTPPVQDIFPTVGVGPAEGYVFLTGQFQYSDDFTVAPASMAPDFEDGDIFYINFLTVTIPGSGKKGEGTWLEPIPATEAPSPAAMDYVDVERSERQYLYNSEMPKHWRGQTIVRPNSDDARPHTRAPARLVESRTWWEHWSEEDGYQARTEVQRPEGWVTSEEDENEPWHWDDAGAPAGSGSRLTNEDVRQDPWYWSDETEWRAAQQQD